MARLGTLLLLTALRRWMLSPGAKHVSPSCAPSLCQLGNIGGVAHVPDDESESWRQSPADLEDASNVPITAKYSEGAQMLAQHSHTLTKHSVSALSMT